MVAVVVEELIDEEESADEESDTDEVNTQISLQKQWRQFQTVMRLNENQPVLKLSLQGDLRDLLVFRDVE